MIREKISQPYQIYDSQIQIGACIGIVISDGESRTDYLYKCADLALYEAKRGLRLRPDIPPRYASAPAGE